MADQVRFVPVMGPDDTIQRQDKVEGRVYFATDTRKIYLDTDKDNKMSIGGAGNSGIYYGTKKEISDEEFEAGKVSFTLGVNIEGKELPFKDDLVLNADGSFYRVISVDEVTQTVVGLRLTVAGSGGGGGTTPSGTTPSSVDVDPESKIDTSDFLYGQPAFVTLIPYAELNRKGEPVNKNGLTLRWKISGKASGEYVEGVINNLVHGVPIDFDFGSHLFPDQINNMEFRVESPLTQNMITVPWAVNCIKLVLKRSTNFLPLTLYGSNFTMECEVEGQISKRLEFWFDGEMVSSKDLESDKIGPQSIFMKNISHGSHSVEMKLFQTYKTAEGLVKGAEVPSQKFEIAVAIPGETDPIIWIGDYQAEYTNYDRIQIPYMVYTPGSTSSIVRIYKGSKELSISPTTVIFSEEATKDFEILEIIDATASDTNGELVENTYSITSGNAAPKFINFKVLQTGKMVLAAQNNLLVKFDSAGRSNSETTISRSEWHFANTDAFGDAATNYKGEFEGFNWYNNGWIVDPDGNTCLRISNGAKFKIPIGNIVFNGNNQGQQSHTFEFQFKIRNVQNYEKLIRLITRYRDADTKEKDTVKWEEYLGVKDQYDSYEQFLQTVHKDWYNTKAEYDRVETQISTANALCNYFSTVEPEVGFCFGTQDAFFKTNESTLTCNYVEDRIINLSLVFQRKVDEAAGLVSIYLNGVLSGAAKVTDAAQFVIQNPYIVFNSDYCDVDLYKFRVYNKNLSIAEVLNNYAVDLRDVVMYNQSTTLSKFNQDTKEYELDYNAMIAYNENNPDEYLMPYFIFSEVQALSYKKDNYIDPTFQFVNPGLDRAYETGELEKDSQDYDEADFPIAWLTAADAAALVAEEQNKSANYFITIDGVKNYIEKAKLDNYPWKIKKKKGKEDVPVMRHLSKVENFYIHHSPSFIAEKTETNVQGTSSQYYPRRNYKVRCKERMYANRGPFEKDPMYIQYFFMDNDKVGTTKFTMKIDYMESSGSYNTGFANLVHGAYSKHPLYDYNFEDKPDTSYLRTNIMGFPVLAFHKKSADNTIFIGRYNMNLDKGSDENFGFKLFKDHDPNGSKVTTPYVLDANGDPMAVADVAECWEFSDNNRGYCSFRDPDSRPELSFLLDPDKNKPEEVEAGCRLNSNKSCPIVADSFEYRYHKDADVLDYIYKPGDAELEETILEDYEGVITSSDLASPIWRRDFLIDKMKNYEKLCKWIWSTNTEMVDSDSAIYTTYGKNNGGMEYFGPSEIYIKETGKTSSVLIYDLHEVNNIFLKDKDGVDGVWTILQNEYGFTESDMKTPQFGSVDRVNSSNNNIVYTYTDEDIFQAYAAVTGYVYKSHVIEEIAGETVVRATFDIGTVVPLSTVLDALAENPKDYATPTHPALEEPYVTSVATYYFDTQEYRLAKFKNEFTDHFDKEYALVYFVMTEVLELYDSRGKNCMMASWGPQGWKTDAQGNPILDENGKKVAKDYIWYPIFYDADTQLGINNTGIPSFDYFVNATEEGCYSTNDSILWGNIFRCFFDDIKACYQNLRENVQRRNDDGSKEPNSAPLAGYEYTNQDPVAHIENWYTCKPEVTKWYCCRGARPLIAINMDEQYKYISIMNSKIGYQGMDGKITTDATGSFLYALQGDRGLSRQQFLRRRINFIDSWLTRGTYSEGSGKQIKLRIAANLPDSISDFWIDSASNKTSAGVVVSNLIPMLQDGTRVDGYYETDEKGAVRYDSNGDPIKINYLDADFFVKLSPFQRSYVTLATDNTPLPSVEYEGSPVRMELPSNVVAGIRKSPLYAEQLLYLYGADYLKDIGNISLLYPCEFELVGASQLQRILLGNDYPGYYNKQLNPPKLDADKDSIYGKPLLKEAVFTNVVIQEKGGTPKDYTLDFASSEKLEIFRALGMNLAGVKFAPGVALNTLHLPKSITSLSLIEARNMKGIISSYDAPTEESLKTWKPQKGIYLEGITNITSDNISSADSCNLNFNTLEILGGNMEYDSYTLLKKLYDIKEQHGTPTKKSNLKISLTGIHWSPYILLEKGYEYKEEEAANYYIDNGHYQLVPYSTYDTEFTWEENIANKSLYIKNTEVPESVYGQINTKDLLENLALNTENAIYQNTDSIGNEIPRITGDIYIHNTDEIEEGWIRNVLQVWYPDLNVFVQNVKKAYSAQFIQVDENDGTWKILETQKISQEDFAKNPNIFFTSPYETYSDMTQKDHYDFYGWSSEEGKSDKVIPQDNWYNERLVAGNFDYKFFIIYQRHAYEYRFYNDDGSLITWIELDEEKNKIETSVMKVLYQDKLSAPLTVPISGYEASLPDDKIYKFIGYSKTQQGEVVDLTTIASIQDLNFYAVYDKDPISIYDDFTYINDMDKYFEFQTAYKYEDETDELFNIPEGGYRIAANPKVKLKGKILLPVKYKGKDIIEIAISGFSGQNEITHIYFQNKLNIKDEYNSYHTRLRRIRDEAFSGCSNLKIFEWPDDLRVIHIRGFQHCRKLASYKIGRNVRLLQNGAFLYAFAAEDQEQKLLNLHLPSTLESIEKSAFAGFSGDTLGQRDIDKIYFGSGLSDVMKVKTTIEDGAFTSTNINKVIVFCNPEDFQNWNTPEMKRLFNNAEIVEGTGV